MDIVASYQHVSTLEGATLKELRRQVEKAEAETKQASQEANQHMCNTCKSGSRAGFSLCGNSGCNVECINCMWRNYNTDSPSCAYCRDAYISNFETLMTTAISKYLLPIREAAAAAAAAEAAAATDDD